MKYNSLNDQSTINKIEIVKKTMIHYYNRNLGKLSKALDFQKLASFVKGKNVDFISFS